jgi:hypothetical protein
MSDTCRSCRFWNGVRKGGNGVGQCLRRGPLGGDHVPWQTLEIPLHSPIAVWPVTEHGQWCGEYRRFSSETGQDVSGVQMEQG